MTARKTKAADETVPVDDTPDPFAGEVTPEPVLQAEPEETPKGHPDLPASYHSADGEYLVNVARPWGPIVVSVRYPSSPVMYRVESPTLLTVIGSVTGPSPTQPYSLRKKGNPEKNGSPSMENSPPGPDARNRSRKVRTSPSTSTVSVASRRPIALTGERMMPTDVLLPGATLSDVRSSEKNPFGSLLIV